MRSLAGPIFMSISTCGAVVFAIFTKYIRDWKMTLRISHSLGFISILYFWFIPESLSWLTSRGKNVTVANELLKAGRINKILFTDDMMDVLENRPEDIGSEKVSTHDKNIPKSKFMDIFQYPRFVFRILACAFCWITNVFVYAGLSYTSISIGGDKFWVYSLVSLIDIPAQLTALFLIDRIGRQKLLVVSYFLSGVAMLISIFFLEIYTIRLISYVIGKFAIEAAFSTIYMFTTEVFPTCLRHRLFGMCSSFGRIGSVVASQALTLQDIYKPLPSMLFAGTALIAGSLSLTFPETLNTPLPNTIEEALTIGKERNDIIDDK